MNRQFSSSGAGLGSSKWSGVTVASKLSVMVLPPHGGSRSGGGAAMSAANSSSTPFLWSAACLAVALQWRPSDDQLTL